VHDMVLEFAPVSATLPTELILLGLAFVLSSVLGLERQFRRKSAGVRTYTLVGAGSALFTLISAYGFSAPGIPGTVFDPSRIAAQIVSGVGFLGAGVIFMRRDVVRGLTTAAAIWMTAAIGMACGAGMPVLALAATGLHLLTVLVLAPLTRFLPSADARRLVWLHYDDGKGVLRSILHAASSMGYETSILATRVSPDVSPPQVRVEMRFRGRPPLQDLVATLAEIPGVAAVRIRPDPTED
jgi:putative Mg2+ transporter-C (MgtC) family protein